MEIGYCDKLPYIYELGNPYARAINPIPVVTSAFLAGEGDVLSEKVFSDPPFESNIIFREDFYDPKTRVKRGRLYSRDSNQPHEGWDSSTAGIETLIYSGQRKYSFIKYRSLNLPASHKLTGNYLYLGAHGHPIRWRILTVDYIHTRELLFTIKAPTSIELFPELNPTRIPVEKLDQIQREFDALIEDVNSEPESVIDHCRDLATAVLRAKCQVDKSYAKDLGNLLTLFIKKFPKKYIIVENCVGILNRLHPRRKLSELESRDLRPLDFSDSELAVACICTILKDLGWAKF